MKSQEFALRLGTHGAETFRGKHSGLEHTFERVSIILSPVPQLAIYDALDYAVIQPTLGAITIEPPRFEISYTLSERSPHTTEAIDAKARCIAFLMRQYGAYFDIDIDGNLPQELPIVPIHQIYEEILATQPDA